ncbi:MAG TPA: hypothetical protein VGK20_13775 [Candidatus Binatia bacterium]|jgi:tetratricopeptide (TPR) repeat protein
MQPRHLVRRCALLLAVTLVASCSATHAPAPPGPLSGPVGNVPFFEGLGKTGRKITTSSPKAQRYFNQGLAFLFAFNHDEAIRSFRKASELDPHAAMAWWGISIASGPHINNPSMTPEASRTAWDAGQRARKEAKKHATATEKDLIDALDSRYADPAPADRTRLDQAYADAMRKVWKNHSDDPDVGALFAEAMMDLRPWNQWTPEGKPQPGTEEVLATLETVMTENQNHPLALHLYIHAVEASHDPGRADVAADRLRNLTPGLGHLVHMPSHIDVRRGRWKEAVVANQKAIKADDRYRAISPHQGFYGLYMLHNHHMLAYAAMMAGRQSQALEAIDTMASTIPPGWAQQFAPIADGYLSLPIEVRVRFGLWDDVLKTPEPGAAFPFGRAMRHFARGTAFSAKGDTKSARAELAQFRKTAAALPADAQFSNNKVSDLIPVADHVLDGEITYREGHRDAALALLRQAVTAEDKLAYDEPPSWILPTRHTLGATLLDAGRSGEAEKVFRADLDRLPNDGWALYGLAESLRRQNRKPQAERYQSQFEKVWAGADAKITSPCACLPGSRGAAGRTTANSHAAAKTSPAGNSTSKSQPATPQ